MPQIPQSVVDEIVHRTESTLGLAPNVAQFHAYDEHQQPIPEPLTAAQYAEWLLKTNDQRPYADLEMLALRYRDAFTSQRSAIGITPGQLAHLAIAADVLEWLVKQKSQATIQKPQVAATTPIAQTPAASEKPAVPAEPTEPEIIPVVEQKKPVAKKPSLTLVETDTDLQLLRKQLLSELGLPEDADGTAASAASLQAIITKKLHTKTIELNEMVSSGAITESDRDSKVMQYRRELERQTIELQSIEARMHLQKGATTKPVLVEAKPIEIEKAPGKEDAEPIKTEAKKPAEQPTQPKTSSGFTLEDHADALKTLRSQEREVLSEMNEMERILSDAGLPPQELKHIRHQLNAMEELMADIQEETDK